MRIENGVRQKGRRAVESLVVAGIGRIDELVNGEWFAALYREHFEQGRQIAFPDRFVERDAHRALVHVSQIDSTGHRALDYVLGAAPVQLDANRVEKILVRYAMPEPLHTFRENR